MKISLAICLLALTLNLISCKKSDSTAGQSNDISESAQQVGDAMSSIDESSGSISTSAGGFNVPQDNKSQDLISAKLYGSEAKTFERITGDKLFEGAKISSTPPVHPLALCYGAIGSSFSACSSGVRTRTFSDCYVGTATVSGSVTLTFSQTACTMASTNDNVSRNPSFTMTGPRGGTLTVSKTGTFGQKVTRTGTSSFEFTNDGIRRVIAKNGTTLYDFTTTVTSPLTFTSSGTRSSRVLTGGTITVTNNSTGGSCSLTPTSVTWGSSCNCPISGSWSGTCTSTSGGASSTTSLTITGCGTGTYTIGSDTNDVTFDRCLAL